MLSPSLELLSILVSIEISIDDTYGKCEPLAMFVTTIGKVGGID